MTAAMHPVDRTCHHPALTGTAAALVLVAATNLLCLGGLARIAGPAFVAVAVAGAWWLSRRRPVAAIEMAMWLWLLGPQVRRVVDHGTSYHEPSIVLVAAPLASLVLAHRVRELRWHALRRPVRPLLIAATAVGVGYAVGAIRIGVQPATGMLLLWGVPVLFGLQIVAVTEDTDELRTALERVFVWGTLLVGVYGIVQFYVVPAWDAYWMTNAPMSSIGSPEPFKVRVFSTLNSPGPAALYLSAAVLFLTSARHPLRIVAQAVGFACLALTVVRAAWLACLLGLVVVMIAGRPRARVTALTALALLAVAALQLSSPALQVVSDRIDESREGQSDDSFVARLGLHQELVPSLADDVVGRGLGASGAAARLGPDLTDGFTDLDSGLLDFGLSLGLPIGLVCLGALTFGGLELARSGLRNDSLPVGIVAGAGAVMLQMVSGNTLVGVGGVMFFVLWAMGLLEVLDRSSQSRRSLGAPA